MKNRFTKGTMVSIVNDNNMPKSPEGQGIEIVMSSESMYNRTTEKQRVILKKLEWYKYIRTYCFIPLNSSRTAHKSISKETMEKYRRIFSKAHDRIKVLKSQLEDQS